MVKSKTVEHFTHVEGYICISEFQSFSYLFEHSVIVNVYFDERSEFTVNECEVTVCAIVWAAI